MEAGVGLRRRWQRTKLRRTVVAEMASQLVQVDRGEKELMRMKVPDLVFLMAHLMERAAGVGRMMMLVCCGRNMESGIVARV